MKAYYLLFFLLTTTLLSAQAPNLDVFIQQQLNSHASTTNQIVSDVSNWRITDHHVSRQSGIHHIYIRQQYQGIDIIGANADIHFLSGAPNNGVFSFHSKFVSNVVSNITNANNSIEPTLTAIEAVEAAANHLGYRARQPLQIIEKKDANGRHFVLSNGGISLEDIPAKLVYQSTRNGQLKLAWDITILEIRQDNWWNIQVDATTGEILNKYNWILQCNWGSEHGEEAHEMGSSCTMHRPIAPSKNTTLPIFADASYNVYGVPVESPNHGVRSIITDPANTTASPYGWHDTNGIDGAEHTITRGNNVYAQEDQDGNNATLGFSPDGGAALDFNFPIDLTAAPSVNVSANITNLFYWNNVIHDVAYHYGFDEISGNFQENNYGNGGAGNDYVLADAQDGSGTNNANFGTPPDGFNPRMQMFLWTAPNPDIDGDLDNGIILHEYGHGISNRLTGGRTTTSCLNNDEQMGEGWSDYWGIMLTMKTGDQGTDARGVGTYAINQSTTGGGIRPHPYSTDMAVNPHTYADIDGVSVPHGVGSVWAEMLWEVTWELIGAHGFSADFFETTAGNNISMALVTEGMKLQPCSPGFVDGRDAILKADTALYNGANSCLIWRAFAKRGLGYSAQQGDSDSVTDGVEAFDLPPGVNELCTADPIFSITISPSRTAVCAGEDAVFEVSVLGFNDYVGTVSLTPSNIPAGVLSSLGETSFSTFPTTTTWTLSNTDGLSAGDYTMTVSGTDGTNTSERPATLEILPIAGPPTLSAPANNSVTASLTQDLEWIAATGATSYHLQVATDAAFTTLIVDETGWSTTKFSTDLLMPNTTYYWRVRSNSCAISAFSTTYQFSISSACGQPFTDSGGTSGDYENNELKKWVFCPDNAGEFISVTFSSFNVERRSTTACWDHLSVYDGNTENATALGQFCGTTLEESPGQGTVTATNPSGCLTFVFFSDTYVTPAGWEATISCLDCSAPVLNGISTIAENCSGANDGQVSFSASGLSTLEYVLTPLGGSAMTNTTGIFSGLAATTYTGYVRNTGDEDCRTSDETIIVPISAPMLTESIIEKASCMDAADATVTLITDFSGSVEYLLTIGGNTIINSTGIFANLATGTYTATIRGAVDNTCISSETQLIVAAESTPAPTNSSAAVNLANLPSNEGVVATCNTDICNSITVQPNAPINASNTTYCETFQVNGMTTSVVEIYVSMKIAHTWVGDLGATLESPDGSRIQLFDGPGLPSQSFGCSQNNLNLIFADTASLTAADLENTCNVSTGPTTYAIDGAFQSINLFATLNGETANGTWTICINDTYASLDHGTVEELTLIVNPEKSAASWWNAAEDGTQVFTGSSFNPVTNGNIEPDAMGRFSYWSECACAGCPSERVEVQFVSNCQEYYADEDGDGYGDANAATQIVCEGETPPVGYVANAIDCDDMMDDVIPMMVNTVTSQELYQATAGLTSTATVSSNNLVTFKAGRYIQLLSGFNAKTGEKFRATIDSCGQVEAAFSATEQTANITPLRKEKENNSINSVFQGTTSLQIAPNPFNQNTTLTFDLEQHGKVQLHVYDSYGRLIKTFFDGIALPTGKHSVIFEGQTHSNGLYMVVLKTKDKIVTERIVLQGK